MSARRLVLAGVTGNAAVGSLFAWSLVSAEAARDLGMTAGGAAAVFAVSVVVMAGSLLATGAALGRTGPRPLLVTAARPREGDSCLPPPGSTRWACGWASPDFSARPTA